MQKVGSWKQLQGAVGGQHTRVEGRDGRLLTLTVTSGSVVFCQFSPTWKKAGFLGNQSPPVALAHCQVPPTPLGTAVVICFFL